ncbi:hypothetical protein AWZ03_014915 [Drosophila navojoa]|uniref:Ubiquitin-like protease family profile domain-containing protein n=1 Tax=Drosophila navojoa TaxID=7232 RepID=A0A484APJ9_DRONA|nr:sentrin-specific protease 8 [Drosophila navojoa]TDG38663.1 hypothetical protein AWZ03_014915 [Drosophila navojoa]
MSKSKKKIQKKTTKKPESSPSRLRVAKPSGDADYVRKCQLNNDVSGKPSVALRFQEISLRHSDVQLLRGPYALNEHVIGFYCAYLQSRRYKAQSELHFLTPSMAYSMRHLKGRERRRLAQGLQLDSKLFVFVPLVDGSHWSLLLMARPDRKFYYFDSEDNRNLKLAHTVIEHLRDTLSAEDFSLTLGRCLQQGTDHDHDSGLHFMCMADNLADYITRCGYATSTLLVSVQEVRSKRSSLLHLIRTLGGILPMSSNKPSSMDL